MLISHQIALKANNKQITYFRKASGVARFAYNWALDEWKKQYEAHKLDSTLPKPSQAALRRQLNAIKREQFPWMLEVTKNAPQMAIIQLGDAFKRFFTKQSDYPMFRKKGVHDRFSLTNDQFQVDDSRVRIPNLGWVRMHESLRFTGKIISGTVSRQADKWFISITVETHDLSHLPQAKNQGVVGVDLGISTLAKLSTGESIKSPKAYAKKFKKLQRLSRDLSRKVKGSNNRFKAKKKLAKLHAKIGNIRSDSLHKLTTDLTTNFHTIVIEDLNVKGMMQNRKLARSIADLGLYEFRRQLDYKSQMRGNLVQVADRWFPSSKLCSVCGYKLEELPLSVRSWKCPVCHSEHDRDLNAAINLKNLAVSSTVSACGEEGSGLDRKVKVKPASVKQEINVNSSYV
jgi:putative transposase